MMKREVSVGDSARCQYNNIGEQASCGSRVFDIRCFLKTSGVFNKTKTPTMGHFFADKPPFGEYGGTLESALNDALNFVKISPSEFLIFRIGHTECLKEVAQVLEAFYNSPRRQRQSDEFETVLPDRKGKPRRRRSQPTPGETRSPL
jgi:hypothetical protein